MNIPFYKVPISDKEIKAVTRTVKSGWLTFGSQTELFEKKFAEYIKAPYCVMVDNCTAAIHLACEYYGSKMPVEFRKLMEIDIPSLTCAATALGPIHAGFSICFRDIAKDDSFLMDTFSESGAYIPVHYAGKKCKTFKKAEIVVEDCAHRIVRGGFNGNIQAYSFYVTKNLTTGEGGMIACKTKEEANWFKKARLYGNSKAIYERKKMYQSGKNFWWFESEFLGWKANPTDIAASLGLAQLSRLDELNFERKRIADRYNKAFGLTTDRNPWHLYPILVNERDKFMYYMKDNGVHCAVHFPPLHKMKAFKKYPRVRLTNTERVYRHIVSLPLYPYMTTKEQNYVIKLVNKWISKYGRYNKN